MSAVRVEVRVEFRSGSVVGVWYGGRELELFDGVELAQVIDAAPFATIATGPVGPCPCYGCAEKAFVNWVESHAVEEEGVK